LPTMSMPKSQPSRMKVIIWTTAMTARPIE
jgi:hypothetical protein